MGLDHFSLLAPFYDRVFGARGADRLKELLALPANGPLLDVGGGTGRVAQSLRGLAAPLLVSDVSVGMLRQTAGKNGLIALNAHAEHLPFADARLARILVVDAFHHFCNQTEAVVELWRVLAPGGRLVIEEPNIETWPVKLIALAEKLALMRSHFYAPKTVKMMFEGLGAQVEIYTDQQQYTAWVVVQK
jgi:ubiquinone/menaquinone biosynthesis C-methylase UbiE